MDLRFVGLDYPVLQALHQMIGDEQDSSSGGSGGVGGGSSGRSSRAYVRDAKAMAATPADVKELQNAYVFVIDMPGVKSGDIKVQVEEENVLVISGERKREEEEGEKEGAKYVRMERRVGKLMRKFVLPENANTDGVKAVCKDGVLTVTVEKVPPPQPKKPKTIQVQIA